MIDYNKYIGIPFCNLGREYTGADCYGLARLFLKDEYGIMLPRLLEYEDSLNHSEIESVIKINTPLLSGKELDKPQDGCMVVLSSGGLSGHVGVVVNKNMILHTTKATGAIIEPLSSTRIKNRIKGYYDVSKNYSTT